jgi:PKD repeat protein
MKKSLLPFTIMAVILMISACKNPPEASFTHNSDSYEEGDTVNFISTSTDAKDHEWDFGDGSTSNIENPFHIFNATGTYTVKLTVSNEDGSDEVSESIQIKDPTILAFYVTEGQSETVIPECAIMLFETEDDMLNLENVKGAGYTDSDGYIDFYHAKAIVYYLYAFKEVTGGTWFFAGSTNIIELNKTNLYQIPAEFFTSKKADIQLTPDMIKSLQRTMN